MLPVLAANGLIGWSLLAFGAVYPWASIPLVLGCALFALAVPPGLGPSPLVRGLDRSLLLFLAAGLVQLVPLPPAILTWLSPQSTAFRAAYLLDFGARPGYSLSLSPAATSYALMVWASWILLFWTCRTLFASGGVRRVVRFIAWLGLLVSLLAIVQRATSPGRIYGWWQPEEPGAQPLGPLVNRNHFATWILMALPLSAGYLLAHARSHYHRRPGLRGLAALANRIDSRMVWLAAAGCMMTLALLASTSRAATLGLVAGAVAAGVAGRGHRDGTTRWVLGLYLVLLVAVVVSWSSLGIVVQRVDDLLTAGEGRSAVWRDTFRIIKDFWLTGAGLGGYQTAMTVYQQAARAMFFNHAHSQYFQLAAEGGLLLGLPATLAALWLVRAARQQLRADRSALRSVRVGAVAGLTAVAVQSIWETGLLTPANGVLLAITAAIAVHRPVRLESKR